MPDQISKQWYRDDYLISTDRKLLQLDAINDAFDSDLMWWAKRVPEDVLRQMIDNSLCLGIYKLPSSTADIAGTRGPELVGFARLVTDYVTMGYLSDVYVLQAHHGRGLAAWLMECLNEIVDSWPELRRFLLLTTSPQASKLYKRTLGTTTWGKSYSGRLYLLEKRGLAMPDGPEEDESD